MANKAKENFPSYNKYFTWGLRILCGGLFIFSGFVKAIDPWGTIIKVDEYLSVFGLDIPFALVKLGVFALCAVEFIVGCFLLLGCFRKSCPISALVIMCFMLPLTLWIAIENPVADCGCFGDALLLSNWATFYKNVLLTGGIIWLLIHNTEEICLITPAFQWLAIVGSGVFVLFLELVGFYYQPLIDFREYKVDTQLFASDAEEGDAGYYMGIDVFDVVSGDDKTSEADCRDCKELVVMIPKVSGVSPATTWKLNSLYQWSLDHGVKMIGIVAGNLDEINEWEDLSMTSYPIYLADDTTILEVVRGNPAIVYLENGIIKWKSSLSAIDIDDFHSKDVSADASTFAIDNAVILRNSIFSYILYMAFLVLISFTPRLARLLIKGGLASKRGVRHH